MKRALLISAVAAMAVAANAQSRSSFQVPSSLTGVTIDSSSKLDYKVILGNNASMFHKGQTRKITDIFGFWVLDNNNDMHAAGTSSAGWQYHENYSGEGGIAGFKTNPNTGITPGNSKNFAFTKVEGTVERYGLHIRLKDCDTLYIEAPCAPVPEPATMAVLGIGVAALIRRRRSR